MNVKLICKQDHDITLENYEDCLNIVELYNNKWGLENDNEDEVTIYYKLKNCTVKYLPKKYDKITFVLSKDAFKELVRFEAFLKQTINIEEFVKNRTIGLKVKDDMKRNFKHKIGENVDIVIKFNSIWKVNGKNYASFEMTEYRKSTMQPEHEKESLLESDDEEA